jgi:hypothetical protein
MPPHFRIPSGSSNNPPNGVIGARLLRFRFQLTRGTAILATLLTLVIVLASASAIEYSMLSAQKTITTTVTSSTTETTTSTTTSTSTARETSTTTSTSTEYIGLNESDDADLLADCVPSQVNATHAGFETLVAGTSSPAILCLQFYEFSSNSTILVNASSILSILGASPQQGFPGFDAPKNFTVLASQDQLLMGGPSNAGEGTIVAYSILSNPGASGTYALGIHGAELTSGSPESCGTSGKLVAGNGQPYYVVTGQCDTFGAPNSNPNFMIPGVSYNIVGDVLYFRIVTITNSTQ